MDQAIMKDRKKALKLSTAINALMVLCLLVLVFGKLLQNFL